MRGIAEMSDRNRGLTAAGARRLRRFTVQNLRRVRSLQIVLPVKRRKRRAPLRSPFS